MIYIYIMYVHHIYVYDIYVYVYVYQILYDTHILLLLDLADHSRIHFIYMHEYVTRTQTFKYSMLLIHLYVCLHICLC